MLQNESDLSANEWEWISDDEGEEDSGTDSKWDRERPRARRKVYNAIKQIDPVTGREIRRYTVGKFVYVFGGENMPFYIAKLLELFEILEGKFKNEKRCLLQWFFRPQEIDQQLIDLGLGPLPPTYVRTLVYKSDTEYDMVKGTKVYKDVIEHETVKVQRKEIFFSELSDYNPVTALRECVTIDLVGPTEEEPVTDFVVQAWWEPGFNRITSFSAVDARNLFSYSCSTEKAGAREVADDHQAVVPVLEVAEEEPRGPPPPIIAQPDCYWSSLIAAELWNVSEDVVMNYLLRAQKNEQLHPGMVVRIVDEGEEVKAARKWGRISDVHAGSEEDSRYEITIDGVTVLARRDEIVGHYKEDIALDIFTEHEGDSEAAISVISDPSFRFQPDLVWSEEAVRAVNTLLRSHRGLCNIEYERRRDPLAVEDLWGEMRLSRFQEESPYAVPGKTAMELAAFLVQFLYPSFKPPQHTESESERRLLEKVKGTVSAPDYELITTLLVQLAEIDSPFPENTLYRTCAKIMSVATRYEGLAPELEPLLPPEMVRRFKESRRLASAASDTMQAPPPPPVLACNGVGHLHAAEESNGDAMQQCERAPPSGLLVPKTLQLELNNSKAAEGPELTPKGSAGARAGIGDFIHKRAIEESVDGSDEERMPADAKRQRL